MRKLHPNLQPGRPKPDVAANARSKRPVKKNLRSNAYGQSQGGLLLAVSMVFLLNQRAAAQQDTSGDNALPPTISSTLNLPGAPDTSVLSSPQSRDGTGGPARSAPAAPVADRFAKYIQPGQSAVQLTGFDKVLLGARHSTSSFAAATWFVSAGYEQILNSRPNYGQTFKGYTQRLGADAARNVSEGIFSDSVLAPILHEDPRYYKLGAEHPLNERLRHALFHPILTQTDNGDRTINFAQIGGNLAGAGLTDAYYPSRNRTAGATLITFGTSMGGGAVGYLFNEFFSIHLPLAR